MSDLHAAIEHFENSPGLRREFAYTLQAMKDARDALEQAKFHGWIPTAKNVNSLPTPLFDYIAGLETLCDPAGIVAENALLKDQTKQLDAFISTLKERIEQLEAAIRETPCKVLLLQEQPYTDCFPLHPCEPCHCGRSLLAGDQGNG